MSDRMPTLQIKYNTAYPVELLYDQPKQGESQYGKYNLYGLDFNGKEYGIQFWNHAIIFAADIRKQNLIIVYLLYNMDNFTNTMTLLRYYKWKYLI